MSTEQLTSLPSYSVCFWNLFSVCSWTLLHLDTRKLRLSRICSYIQPKDLLVIDRLIVNAGSAKSMWIALTLWDETVLLPTVMRGSLFFLSFPSFFLFPFFPGFHSSCEKKKSSTCRHSCPVHGTEMSVWWTTFLGTPLFTMLCASI